MIKIYQTVQNQNNLITTIPFKGVKVQVEFTGGNVMKNIPAKFYCRDPFTMRALDESDQNGRLFRLLQVIPEEGDNKPKQPAAPKQPEVKDEGLAEIINKMENTAQQQAPNPPDFDSAQGTPAPKPEVPAQEPAKEPEPEPAPEPEQAPEQTDGEGETGEQPGGDDKLEFENLAAAVTYIASKYNEQVETENQVRKFIEEREGRKCLIHKG